MLSSSAETLKKVSLKKTAQFKFLNPDSEGNLIPTSAKRCINTKTGEIIIGISDEKMETLLSEDRIKRSKITFPTKDPNVIEEMIVTSESNDMLVYHGIIFYKSSATSSITETKGRDTWIPSLGLDDKSSHGVGSTENVFKITKLDRYYDKKFGQPDKRLEKYQIWLDQELMNKFNNFDIMILSAEIGGGFWNTTDGLQVIEEMRKDGIFIIPGIVKIKHDSEDTFTLPFEVKMEDQPLITQKTADFNLFFTEQKGCLHNGLVNNAEQKTTARDVHKEIYERAAKATNKNRNRPDTKYPSVIAAIEKKLLKYQLSESAKKVLEVINKIQIDLQNQPFHHDYIASCRSIMHVMSKRINMIKERQKTLSGNEKNMALNLLSDLVACNEMAGKAFITLASHFEEKAQPSTPHTIITLEELNQFTREQVLSFSYANRNIRYYINAIYDYIELNEESKHEKEFQRARKLLLSFINGQHNDQTLLTIFLSTGGLPEESSYSLFSSRKTNKNSLHARLLAVQETFKTPSLSVTPS